MTAVLCLSVRQPFADRIVRGVKRVEYRSWRTPHRGPPLVHASGHRGPGADPALPRGALVGTVVLAADRIVRGVAGRGPAGKSLG